MKTTIIQFFLNEAPDHAGRMFSDIQKFKHRQLELSHDYIQWLFPLPEASKFNKDAPLLTNEDINEIKINTVIQKNIIKSFEKMLGFYGFELKSRKNIVFVCRDVFSYESAIKEWMNIHNHNYLRITRILKFLKLVGMDDYAEAFFDALDYEYLLYERKIGSTTYQFWKEAIL